MSKERTNAVMNEGTQLINELKMAYADAMWVWAQVETNLFTIYASTVDPNIVNVRFDELVARREWSAMRAAFFSINSFEMRLVMTNASAKISWAGHHYLDLWSEIYGLCTKENKRRGKIAHLTGGIFEAAGHHQHDLAVLHQPFGHIKFPEDYGRAKSEGFTAQVLNGYRKEWTDLLEKIDHLSHMAINIPLREQSCQLASDTKSE